MSATARVYIEDPAAALATYEELHLYRDSTPEGEFVALAGSTLLLPDTYEYVFEDGGGSSLSWYRFRLYHPTGPIQSDLSAPFQAGVALSWLRMEVAIRAHAGFRGTVTGGTIDTLVDETLRDNGLDQAFMSGIWIYRPGSIEGLTASDRLRRTANNGFDPATGTFTVVRPYTSQPPLAGEEYHAYALVPPVDQAGVPYSWNRAIREALEEVRFPDLLVLGHGDGVTTRFELDTHVNQARERHIQRVWLRTVTQDGQVIDRDAQKAGGWWSVQQNTPASLTLIVQPAPTADELVVVEAMTRDAALYRDDDITAAPPELVIRAAVMKLFEHMNTRIPGRYQAEYAGALASYNAYAAQVTPQPIVRLV